jgi:putative ABC transport system permease protein
LGQVVRRDFARGQIERGLAAREATMRLERWFNKSSSWLRLLLHRREAEQALDEEIQFHLDAKTEQYIEKGMAPVAARRAACIELGGVEQVKEQVRAVRAAAGLETFVQDVRFGLRLLRKSPVFTTVAVLILGLGIGANTAVFSIINVLLRSLPVRDPGQLVELLHQHPANLHSTVSRGTLTRF